MVYNAMKLFMEVNPQLFDECSHDYTEQQNQVETVKAQRQARWDRLSALADSAKANANGGTHSTTNLNYGSKSGPRVTSPIKEENDQLSQESQQRMERLRLQDERERRPKDYEKQSNSVR